MVGGNCLMRDRGALTLSEPTVLEEAEQARVPAWTGFAERDPTVEPSPGLSVAPKLLNLGVGDKKRGRSRGPF